MTKLSNHWLLAGIGLLTLACASKVEVKFVGADQCGDGEVTGDELCDDGNAKAGDGCSKTCQPEAGYACSGEPSTCVKSVGNGKIDAGEECDDGNIESDDGCSASGLMEGSCKTPYLIALTDQNGTLTGRFDGSSASGGSSVPAADCGGQSVGAGNDRVFQIHLEAAADLKLTLESPANLLLRFNGVCEGEASPSSCQNAAGAGTAEVLEIPNVPAGDHLIVVDGVKANANDDFTLTVQALCSLSNLKLDDVAFNQQRFSVRNISSSCAVDTSRVGAHVNWGNGTATFNLPAGSLAAGKSRVYQPTKFDNVDSTVIEGTPWTGQAAGTSYLLCSGSCDTQAGSNVVDALRIGAGAPALPGTLSFADAPVPVVTTTSPENAVYGRAAYSGSAAGFLASDWDPYFSFNASYAYFNYTSYLYTNGVPTSGSASAINNSPNTVRAWDDKLGAYYTRIGTAAAVGDVPGFRGYNLAVAPELRKPRQVDFSLRTPASGATWQGHCYVYLGSAALSGIYSSFNNALGDFAYIFINNAYSSGTGVFTVASYNNPVVTQYTQAKPPGDTWQYLSFRNIDWTKKTFDLYLNDTLVKSGGVFANATGIVNIFLGNYNNTTYCDYGPITLR